METEMSSQEHQAFWERFRNSVAARSIHNPRLYDTMEIGSNPREADAGAALILAGRKTATSSLSTEYGPFRAAPFVGALSIVVDGSGLPVAVVETVEVALRRLDDLDDAFARDYGEWEPTAQALRSELATYYGKRLGLQPDGSLELICERFRIIYSEAS